MLFKSPSPRQFQFQFKMFPRTKAEAQQIIKIVQFFRVAAYPQLGSGSGTDQVNMSTLKVPFTYKFCPTVKSPEDAVILADGTVPDVNWVAFNDVKFAPEPKNADAVTTPEEFTEETVIFGDPVRFCATVDIPEVDA